MMGRSPLSIYGSFREDDLGSNTVAMIGNLCFKFVVTGVVIFTIIAATFKPEDPLLFPAAKITSILTSSSNANFRRDETFISTGVTSVGEAYTDCLAELGKPIDCRDPDIFHLMMRYAIDTYKDLHFAKFGKPVQGSNDSSCDMTWRFRPIEGKPDAFVDDYRRFAISRSENCTFSVVSIGDHHSGTNARKRKTNEKPGGSEANQSAAINDTVPLIESEGSFVSGRYLIYSGGGDRCKTMNHYLWSFLCALGEAQYLKRTLVMDLTICLSSVYSFSKWDEEGKDFRFYFDFEHLTESVSVVEQGNFWSGWGKWQKKNGLNLFLVEDFRVTPMKLANVKDTLIMRKFGAVEPDNYWYKVCEGETDLVIQRPWHLVRKSKRLMNIVSAITARLNSDFDSVYVERGKKARNTEQWPNLARDTSPEALLSTLLDKIEDGRNLYIATNEPDTSFFDPLKGKYTIHFLNDYKDLWDEESGWFRQTKKLNNLVPVEFDGYMKMEVDSEVFLRGEKQIETFNDLTSDCEDGVNTC